MASSVNNLTLLINRQDSSGVNVENRSIGAVSYSGVSGEFDVRQATGTSITTLDLPTATVLQFYFRNTHATAQITLTGTIQGGATQSMCVLPPGGVFVYWAPVTSTTVGFTQLRFTSDTTGATFELFIGG